MDRFVVKTAAGRGVAQPSAAPDRDIPHQSDFNEDLEVSSCSSAAEMSDDEDDFVRHLPQEDNPAIQWIRTTPVGHAGNFLAQRARRILR